MMHTADGCATGAGLRQWEFAFVLVALISTQSWGVASFLLNIVKALDVVSWFFCNMYSTEKIGCITKDLYYSSQRVPT